MADYLKILKRAVAEAEQRAPEPDLKGQAVELYWRGESLFLVADEDDAARLAEPRGQTYTIAEATLLARIEDPEVIAEIHAWKRTHNGILREGRA
jgi:hypothetical protein